MTTQTVADADRGRRPPARVPLAKLGRFLAPILAFAVVVALWESGTLHSAFGLEEYTVPYPTTIVEVITGDWVSLWGALKITLTEAVVGYAIGNVVGLLAALTVVATGWGSRVLPGIAGALNSVPIVAVAPVSILYFGFGQTSKVAVVALMTAAVMLLNGYKGLTTIDSDPLDLMYSYAAGRRATIVKVRLPLSLPFLFTALKYNVTLALVGAIIAEFFGGFGGVGLQMVQALAAFGMPRAWALMVLVGLIGVIWFQIVVLVERISTRWHESMRPTQG